MKLNLLFAAFALVFTVNCGAGVDPSRCTSNNQCSAGMYCDTMLGLCTWPNHSSGPTDAGSGGGFNLGGLPGLGGSGGGSGGLANKTLEKCTTDAQCGANGTCNDTNEFGRVCMNSCKKPNGTLDPKMCAAGSVCNPELGVCFTTCVIGVACSRPEFTCQHIASTTTTCIIENPVFNNWLFTGQDCTESSQCSNGSKQGVCLKNWSGGYCSGGCTKDADCDGYGVCAGIKDPQTQVVTNFCAAGCGTGSPKCRDGYTCHLSASDSNHGFCVPK